MYVCDLNSDTLTMEPQQKVTRSTARHLRRKRMNVAKKTTEKAPSNSRDNVLSEVESQESMKNRKNLEGNAVLDSQGKTSNVSMTEKSPKPNSTSSILAASSGTRLNVDKEHPITKKSIVMSKEESKSPEKSSEKKTENSPKMKGTEKSKEEIKAEREAKKAAKAAAKAKVNVTETEVAAEITRSPETQDQEEKAVKSKAELRMERRAKQEAQRAAKQELVSSKNEKAKTPVEGTKKKEPEKKVETAAIVPKPVTAENRHEVNLFKHLYIKKKPVLGKVKESAIDFNVHPAIVELGVRYADRIVVGSNARCVALLAVVKEIICDFERPSQADFTRSLETCLQESVAYLNSCRPLSVSMQNALRHLKWQMTLLQSSISDEEAKTKLTSAVDVYINEQILLAKESISLSIQSKISNGDVILTYGHSSLIHKILCDAHTNKKEFRVVVVDGRPWLEGKELLRKLVKHGIKSSYVLINALSFIMPEVSKVFLGAHAILANGAVMSRAGTAQVALVAKAFNVPVLVACETHKSSERVHTDSIVYNELGNDDELMKTDLCTPKKSCLANWRTRKSLNLLNLTYDVTPADLVTAVVTELAILPCTSVPVILRIKPSEI